MRHKPLQDRPFQVIPRLLEVLVPTLCWTCLSSLVVARADSQPRVAALPDLPPLRQGIVLGRPTDTSITAHVVAGEDVTLFLEYGTDSNDLWGRTETIRLRNGESAEIEIAGLRPDARYVYRLQEAAVPTDTWHAGDLVTFHTQRTPGNPFTFAVQADSHLDGQSIPPLYERTLANEAADTPDFVIDLGDTSMSDKLAHKTYEAVEDRHLLQRSYFSLLCHSVPLFLALGNHDGEAAWLLDGTPENLAVWSTLIRKRYFPNPMPDGFYTGDTTEHAFVGLRQSYYAWHWGDALFVVLDPYGDTTSKPGKNPDGWGWTLGKQQYDWLGSTLSNSNAPFKFVFSHQIIGGDSQGRGGAEWVPYYEMGGRNTDGSWGFDRHRPGWAKPIHPLMAEHGVSIFFHGHDHFFARQQLDGIIYQLVPQPGHRNFRQANVAQEYGYVSGEILPNSGHLRVVVRPSEVTVEYVRAYLPEIETEDRINGIAAVSYRVEPR